MMHILGIAKCVADAFLLEMASFNHCYQLV